MRAVTRFPQTRGEGCCESTPDAAAAYLKICALLVPKEMKLEHTNSVSSLSDEELDQAIAAIKAMLAAQAGEPANVIEGTVEPVALPAPEAQSEPTPAPKLPRNRTA